MSSENTQGCLNIDQVTEAHAGAFDLAVKVTDRNQNVSRNANGVHHLVSTMWTQSRDDTGFCPNKCESKVNFIYFFKLMFIGPCIILIVE